MPIRIAVTARNEQVVRALYEAAQFQDVAVIPLGRPDLDLGVPKTIEPALRAVLVRFAWNLPRTPELTRTLASTHNDFVRLGKKLEKSTYGQYLLKVANEKL